MTRLSIGWFNANGFNVKVWTKNSEELRKRPKKEERFKTKPGRGRPEAPGPGGFHQDALRKCVSAIRKALGDRQDNPQFIETRWLIEEFHKALKTGTKAEDLQLETAESLFAAIALKSVVALRLLDLRERLRLAPEAPAEDAGLNELELTILRQALHRPIKTVGEVALVIGRLGGHLNRKSGGLPGWQTLFRGMTKLNSLVEGACIALKLKRFG